VVGIKVPPDRRYHAVWRAFRIYVPPDMPIKDAVMLQFGLLLKMVRGYEAKYHARWDEWSGAYVAEAPPVPNPDELESAAEGTRVTEANYLDKEGRVPVLVWFRFIEPVVWIETDRLIEREKQFREEHQVELPEPLQKLVRPVEEVIKGERTT